MGRMLSALMSGMRFLAIVVTFASLAPAYALSSEPGATTLGVPAVGQLRVGKQRLSRCHPGSEYYCGTLRVAFDPAGQIPGKIAIAFAWLPHVDRQSPSRGTIVAVEGGPGYPSIGSRALYRALYAPLLATRDLLLVDNRGTGASDAIDCEPLQRAPLMRLRDVTRCGRELGRTADLFGTGIAADDMAAILDALEVDKVDLYGDSYGTSFVEAFAGRHPRAVRSIVLDGAYPVVGGNAWYPSTGPTIRRAFDLVCARSLVCSRLGGSSITRIEGLLRVLRSDRSSAPTYRARTGGRERVTVSDVAFVMDSSGLDPLAFRDLDAAARAYLARRDAAPLARLVEEAYANEEGAGGPAKGYSQGLFVAASCADNPQVYDMRLSRHARVLAWQEALERKRERDPLLYAPFTIDEFLGIPIDYAYVPLCSTWPVASPRHPAGEPVPPGTQFPAVPTLVLTGDLDTITTPAEGDAAAMLFPRASHVIVANTGHVSALGDLYGCASNIVRRFTETGQLTDGCASAIPALHLVPSFARVLAEVEPATPLPGNRATTRDLRAAAAGMLAAADVLARAYEFTLASGAGLRGGTFNATSSAKVTHVTMNGVGWTQDLGVWGTALSNAANGHAAAHIVLGGAAAGTLDAVWITYGRQANATIVGTVDERSVRASMPAP
jgi:pimeloyl-ACP methyl ester carboxylesterase